MPSPDAPAAEPVTGRRRSRPLLAVGGLVLVAAILWFVGWPAIAANVERVGGWFFFLVAIYAFAQAAFALGWWVLFERPARPRFRELFGVYLAGDAANSLAPGNVAGEPLKVHLLRAETGAGAALASVTIHKHADLVAQWLFIAIGVTVALVRYPLPFAARTGAIAATAGLGGLLLVMSWALPRGTYAAVLRRLALWRPLARRIERLQDGASRVDGQIAAFYSERPGRFAISAACCFLGWCGGLLETWIVLRLLFPGSGWGAAFAVEGLAMTLNNVFLFIPGRIGSAEGIRVGVFVLLGMPAAQGAAYALLRRGRELAWTVPGVLRLFRSSAGRPTERRAAKLTASVQGRGAGGMTP
ncbi:MAG: flippase-like domain-containing protein [Acidobacteriota bacterium]